MTLIFYAFLVFFTDVDGNVGSKAFSFDSLEACETYKNETLGVFLTENHEQIGVSAADWNTEQPCQAYSLPVPNRPLDPSSDPHSH